MMHYINTPSPNFGPRRHGGPIDMLVLHYTATEEAGPALNWLCNPKSEVSSHYLVEKDGKIHLLVDEKERAWHAGVSYWRGIRDVNSQSIGIEIVNPGDSPFPDTQIEAVIALCQDILSRHPISAQGIVGHSDVAPTRKIDPGALFPWPRLAKAGIGVFPEAGQETQQDLTGLLTTIGYDPGADTAARISAFQRRFCPDHITGDASQHCAMLAAAYLALLA